jgi:hypothetical protein
VKYHYVITLQCVRGWRGRHYVYTAAGSVDVLPDLDETRLYDQILTRTCRHFGLNKASASTLFYRLVPEPGPETTSPCTETCCVASTEPSA